MQYYLQEGTVEDLKIVYPLLASEFIAEELKSEEQITHLVKSSSYKIFLLKSENELVGFACICEIRHAKMMWIDYIVICDEFRNQGIGTKFMKLIIEETNELNGIFFEVEIPNSDNDATRREQVNRIKFYEKFGAKLVLDKYLLPHDDGAFPMWLWVIPCKDEYYPNREVTFQSTKFIFDLIHSDIPTRHDILNNIINMNETVSVAVLKHGHLLMSPLIAES